MGDLISGEHRPQNADEEHLALLDVLRVAATPVDHELPADLAHLQEAVIEHARVALAQRVPKEYWPTPGDFPAGWKQPHLVVDLLVPWLLGAVAPGAVGSKERMHGVVALALSCALVNAMDGQRGAWVRAHEPGTEVRGNFPEGEAEEWDAVRVSAMENEDGSTIMFMRQLGRRSCLRNQLRDLVHRGDVQEDARALLRDVLAGAAGADTEALLRRVRGGRLPPEPVDPLLLTLGEDGLGILSGGKQLTFDKTRKGSTRPSPVRICNEEGWYVRSLVVPGGVPRAVDSTVRSHVRIAFERLKGRIQLDGKGRKARLVPVPRMAEALRDAFDEYDPAEQR